MNIVFRYWGLILFVLSSIAILSALIAEHIYNLLPCKMCLNQRYPYYFIIGTFIIYFFLRHFISIKKLYNIGIYILSEFALIYGLFYSVWHVGIEQKIFKGPSSCANTVDENLTLEEIKNKILNQDIVSCTDINWSILGFSAATINTILFILFILFNTIFIYYLYEKTKKEN